MLGDRSFWARSGLFRPCCASFSVPAVSQGVEAVFVSYYY